MDTSTILFDGMRNLHQVVGLASDFAPLSHGQRDSYSFRGQSSNYGKLTTALSREIQSRGSNGAIFQIERFLMREFRRRYAERREAQAKMPEPESIGQSFDLRCLSVMQHYEVTTRLLDWTSNYWIGLFFACAGQPNSPGELWIYRRDLFSEQLEDPTLASLCDRGLTPAAEPPHVAEGLGTSEIYEIDFALTPRMRAQHAHHTFCIHPWVDHADVLSDRAKNQKTPFYRLVISPDAKPEVLRFISDVHDINADTVFPDMAGLARHLREQAIYWSNALGNR